MFAKFPYLCGALAPEDPSTAPKSQKGRQKEPPRVPRRSQEDATMSPGSDFSVERLFLFATSSTWCSDGSLGAPSKPKDIKNDPPKLQKSIIFVCSYTHKATHPQDIASTSAAGTRRRRLIRCAVHTLVCSYAGVSGHPVLPHAVPPHPLHIYYVRNLQGSF